MNNITIKSNTSDISLTKRLAVAEAFFKENTTVKYEKDWANLPYPVYTVKEYIKYPCKIKLEGYWPEYWVKCKKTKTGYTIEMWYA